MTNKEIGNKTIKNNKEQNINIMVWNCNSLRNYTKRTFLIEQLLINNIHIALLQETMLNEYHKMYIKGYKIYRSNSTDNRKGVAILINNELDCQTYKVNNSTTGRYIKVKIKPNGKDIEEEYRAGYLNGEILYVYKKISSEDDWKHNLSNGAIPLKVDETDINRNTVLEIAKGAGKAVNAKFVTVDISKARDGRLFVMEINGNVCMSKFAEYFPDGYEITKSIYEKAIDLMMD